MPVSVPVPDRRCQCKASFCPCEPCPNEMDAEDLLCAVCRSFKGKAGMEPHCHRPEEDEEGYDSGVRGRTYEEEQLPYGADLNWYPQNHLPYPDVTEEELKEMLRKFVQEP